MQVRPQQHLLHYLLLVLQHNVIATSLWVALLDKLVARCLQTVFPFKRPRSEVIHVLVNPTSACKAPIRRLQRVPGAVR